MRHTMAGALKGGKIVKSAFKAVLAALGFVAVGVSAQPSEPQPAKPPFPQIELPQKARGAQAVHMLGARLPEVAAWYGKSPAEFAAILRRDPMAWIDRKGRMLYEEEVEPPTGTAGSPTTSGRLVSLDQTFKLHSKPGSKRTIYLNFVGATLTNTVWNGSKSSIAALPFDLDGVPYSFSSTELQRIQMIWQRVAEDYAAFDVNVTTEPPPADALTRSGSTDTTFGTTVLITKRTFYSCSCGGVAYIGVFDDTSNYYKPALVFYDRLGAGSEKYVAEAISHEAGHNMGLHHDGSSTTSYYQGHGDGATGWAPIMGVGYYKSLVQWSRGEYPYASNKEDDFAVMAANGLPLRADDHGNTTGSARRLGGTTANGVTTLAGAGILERSTDVDVFSFVAGPGTVNVSVRPAARSGNADLRVSLLNGSGTVIATSNPVDALNGTLTATTATGGTFFVSVRGTGKGTLSTGYSSYGSVGEYSVSGTVPAPVARALTTAESDTAPVTTTDTGTTTAGGTTASMSVAGITVQLSSNKSSASAVALVTVIDTNGNRVAGAVVTGTWSGVVSGSGSATTSSSGVASIRSERSKSSGAFTFTVEGVSRDGYLYVQDSGVETSDSATR
jgi:hypothetical protein